MFSSSVIAAPSYLRCAHNESIKKPCHLPPSWSPAKPGAGRVGGNLEGRSGEGRLAQKGFASLKSLRTNLKGGGGGGGGFKSVALSSISGFLKTC